MISIMSDEYSHNDIGIVYICENILGPTEKTPKSESLVKAFNSQLMHSCKCKDKCVPDSCKCLEISGGENYTLHESKVNVLNKKSGVNIYPIIECNDLCKCSYNCGNRLVQYGPLKTLYVKSTLNKSKGLGLFTHCFIAAGSFVCEYAGEVLTKSQALFRHHYNETHKKMNFIICLNEHVAGKTLQTYVDPSNFGNIGRYINHSCDPNCEILPVRINSPIAKLAVFSILDIEPDNEITFDYGLSDRNDPDIDNAQRKLCLCNTTKCRRFMPCLSY